jgi:ribose transport system permease protein
MPPSADSQARAPLLTRLATVEGATVLVALALLVVFTSLHAPAFLTIGNIQNVLVQSVFLVVLGIGMTFVLISGGIDLSVGSTMGLSAALCLFGLNNGVPFPICVLLGLLSGGIIGVVNAYFVTVLGIADFIVTLAMMSFVRGIVELMTANQEYDSRLPAFQYIAGGQILGVPFPVIIAVLVATLAGVVLARTRIGRAVYAAGLNPRASYLAGVRVNRVRGGAYVFSGVMAALTGIMLASRLSSVQPELGVGYELTAIAAAAIGGTSLAGGRGAVLGTVLGALLLGVLRNSLSLSYVNAFWFQIITGVTIVIAVLLDGSLRSLLRRQALGAAR